MKKYITILGLIAASTLYAQTPTSPTSPAAVPQVTVITTGSADTISAIKVQLAQQINRQAGQNVAFYNRLKAFTATPQFAALDQPTQTQILAVLASTKTAVNTVVPGTIQ